MYALIIYMLLGLALAWRFLPSLPGTVRCWLGLVTGCAALMWLPCLPAFFLGFNGTAENLALCFSAAVILALGIESLLRRGKAPRAPRGRLSFPAPDRTDLTGLLLAVLATVLCAYLLHTHVILPREGDGLWVGQSTYGDLAMHLGFAESLYRQGTFPPEYSIFPGQPLNYPFLVDAASASLRFYGLSLRMSFIAPSIVMLFCVFWGFWLLAQKLTRRLGASLMAWLLFVFNGGFGFLFFLGGEYSFSDIFTGFYTTPTNLTGRDIRWVNVICDMLIPQRTTMAGWCILLGAVFLLITALEKLSAGKGGRRELLYLAVLAGAMPMIHTHSFLALGILSAVWFFCALPAARRNGQARTLLLYYVLYGAICLLLAAPQFFRWTMSSVESGNLLRWNLGWVAGANGALNNWLLFFIVNVGVVFLALFPMLPSLRGERLGIFLGGAAIFLLSNVVAFQPNLYDNNKLLYVWYMLTDILVCGWLWELLSRLRVRALRGLLAAALLLLGTFSGILSIIRETVSEYQLLSEEQVAAADFILENTAPDATFLTASDHRNPVAVLTGRNIVCGPGLYLYWHGVDYQQREAELPLLYRGGEDFARRAERLGIDYVYIGPTEYARYDVNYGFFLDSYPLIYEADGISVFQIS